MLVLWLSLVGCAPKVVQFGPAPVESVPRELTQPEGTFADGRVLTTEARDGAMVLVMQRRDGKVLWESSFPITVAQTPFLRFAVSPDEERIAASSSAGGGLVLFTADGERLWQTDVVGGPQWADDMSSITVSNVRGMDVTVVRLDPETGVETARVTRADIADGRLLGTRRWVDGAWHLLLQGGGGYRLVRWSSSGGLVSCAWDGAQPHWFRLDGRTLVADATGAVYQWQTCEVAAEPIATIPAPADQPAEMSGAAREDWLAAVDVVDGVAWVQVADRPEPRSLASDWTWRDGDAGYRTCDEYVLPDDPEHFACVLGSPEKVVQVHRRGARAADAVDMRVLDDVNSPLDYRWRFLPDESALLGVAPRFRAAVLVDEEPARFTELAAPMGAQIGPRGQVTTLTEGRIAVWDGASFVPQGPQAPCEQPSAWTWDDGEPVVVCDGELWSLSGGDARAMPLTAPIPQDASLVDLDGDGHFYVLSTTVEQVVEDGRVRAPTPMERALAARATDTMERRWVRGEAPFETERAWVYTDGQGGVAQPLDGELARSPNHEWALFLESGRWVARQDPLVFSRSHRARIAWTEGQRLPSERVRRDLDVQLDRCVTWADDPYALEGLTVHFRDVSEVSHMSIDGAPDSVSTCLAQSMDWTVGAIDIEGTLVLE